MAHKRKSPCKAKARSLFRSAIQCGRIIRQPCEVCGEPKSDGHHDDYAKPLTVRWLCRKHHREHHRIYGYAPSDGFKSFLVKQIDDDLWRRVKLRAWMERRTLQAVVSELVTAYATGEITEDDLRPYLDGSRAAR